MNTPKRDSSNAMFWIFSNVGSCKFHFLLSEIKAPSSQGHIYFKHIGRSANATADSQANNGVERDATLINFTIYNCYFRVLGIRLL